jgi:hypothetical protein
MSPTPEGGVCVSCLFNVPHVFLQRLIIINSLCLWTSTSTGTCFVGTGNRYRSRGPFRGPFAFAHALLY